MIYHRVFVDGIVSDIIVRNGKIISITPSNMDNSNQRSDNENVEDYNSSAWALPGLVNMHVHSAMTLFRSVGSGLPLMRWLNEAIFPLEAKLTPEDIYRGAREACEEMLATGTSTVNDMYFSIDSTIRAAIETGVRLAISHSMVDNNFNNPQQKEWTLRFLADYEHRLAEDSPNVKHVISPHSIYAVSKSNLLYLADFAAEHDMLFHIHISETQFEREQCIKEHGVPPVVYLEHIGVLPKVKNRFIGAHALWLDDDEVRILGGYGATVVHCPNSNLKLGSGAFFRYTELCNAGVNVTLGTDGCASSDNLDMIEAMKVMSLLQKGNRQDPTVLPANEVFNVATRNGARALGFDADGLSVGHPANFFLVDLNHRSVARTDWSSLAPSDRVELFLNRLIYAANGSAVIKTIVG